MRVVDAKQRHAQLHPAQHHIAQRQPQIGHCRFGVELDVDDVLVLLRRVLGMANAAVRTPTEPAGVLLEPGVIGRALHGKIQCHFQAMFTRHMHQLAKFLEAAELRVHGVVAALLAADRVGAAGVSRAGLEAVVRPLAMRPADGMNRRKIQHIEAHPGDLGDACVHVGEGAVALLVAQRTGNSSYQLANSARLRSTSSG